MNPLDYTHHLTDSIDKLSRSESYQELFHQQRDGELLPSSKELDTIVELARTILFPGYYGNSSINSRTIEYHIGVNVEKLYELLTEQIFAGLCFVRTHEDDDCREIKRNEAAKHAIHFIGKLPELRHTLATDVKAAYDGDPAAVSIGEVILCYPAIKAICNYRIAHELLSIGVPLIPRMITEMAHSETGIDIHPGARIGKYFTIDHGTGVVIGATTIIGHHVKLYQGVTLGAKSFPLDENGQPIKGIDRHPIIEDNVIIYSNATILGRITIGEGAVIGGNIWVTEDVPQGERIVQRKARK